MCSDDFEWHKEINVGSQKLTAKEWRILRKKIFGMIKESLRISELTICTEEGKMDWIAAFRTSLFRKCRVIISTSLVDRLWDIPCITCVWEEGVFKSTLRGCAMYEQDVEHKIKGIERASYELEVLNGLVSAKKIHPENTLRQNRDLVLRLMSGKELDVRSILKKRKFPAPDHVLIQLYDRENMEYMTPLTMRDLSNLTREVTKRPTRTFYTGTRWMVFSENGKGQFCTSRISDWSGDSMLTKVSPVCPASTRKRQKNASQRGRKKSKVAVDVVHDWNAHVFSMGENARLMHQLLKEYFM